MGIKTSKDKKSKSKGKEEIVKKKKKSKEGEKVERSSKKKKGEKKARKVKAVIEVKPIKEKLSRMGLINHLVDETAVEAKSVKKVLAALEATIKGSIMKKGLGEFTFPGLFKVKTKFKPKQKGGEKKQNPFKPGEFIITKPKPASIKVKILAMKKLKDAAALPPKE